LAQSTQDGWKRELLLAQRTLGDLTIDKMKPSVVQAHIDGMSDFPGKQQTALSALKNMEKWALVRDMLAYPITTGVETIDSGDDGHEPWSDAEIETAIQNARPDLGRAIALAFATGQRGSDIVRMRWSDIEVRKGWTYVRVIQQKTGRKLSVPLFGLQIDKWERTSFFLVPAPNGGQYTRNRLSHEWQRERDSNPALISHKERRLVLHGLRASAVVRLRIKKYTELEICNFVGMSGPMVARYSRLANQQDLVEKALERNENPENSNVVSFREKSE
jgi:integrase